MSLPSLDIGYLTDRGTKYSLASESNMTCLVLEGYKLPNGYDRDSADLLLRLSPGYPDVPPDMWWFSPAVRRKDGKQIQATDSVETYLGRQWQRWSRHFVPGQWQSGIDSIESFLALVSRELTRCASVEYA